MKALKEIHDDTYGVACKKIDKYQKKYKKQYDKTKKVKPFTFKIGAKVRYKHHFSKKAKGAKSKIQYLPAKTYLVIHKIYKVKKKVILKNPTTGYIHKKNFHFDDIRRYKSTIKKSKKTTKK